MSSHIMAIVWPDVCTGHHFSTVVSASFFTTIMLNDDLFIFLLFYIMQPEARVDFITVFLRKPLCKCSSSYRYIPHLR